MARTTVERLKLAGQVEGTMETTLTVALWRLLVTVVNVVIAVTAVVVGVAINRLTSGLVELAG